MFNIEPAALILLGVGLMFYENFVKKNAPMRSADFPLSFFSYVLIILGFAWWWSIPEQSVGTTVLEFNGDKETAKIITSVSKLLWPIALVLAVLIFRSRFASAIDRLASFTLPGGAAASFTNQPENLNPTDDISQSPQYAQLRPYIKSVVDRIATNAKALPKAQERESLLTIYAGVLTAQIDFEVVYNAIFGSQIDALRFLNTQNSSANIHIFYEAHVSRVSELPNNKTAGTFIEWVKFLVNNELTQPQPNEHEFSITDKGKEFLAFLVEKGRPLNRAL